jgi:dTDP-4-dehydrorhamnose reductase
VTVRIYITGINGQLGRTLARHWESSAEVMGGDLPAVDITDPGQITTAIVDARPDLVVHCAAMTDVDGCALDPDLAYRVNGYGTQNVVIGCQQAGAALVHVSTNEVFSGRDGRAYHEFDRSDPINPYGFSKMAGEWFVRHLIDRFFIVRTAWLYAPGGRNFIHAIRSAAEAGRALRVVTDEVANPTYVEDLAAGIVALVATGRYGIYHLTNAGACSRYTFAREILALTGHGDVSVAPILQAEWPRASTPPPFAPLENCAAAALGVELRSWKEALADYLAAHG